MADLAIRKVAVIGSGISGVVAAAHLLSEGLDVAVFERNKAAGGVWYVSQFPFAVGNPGFIFQYSKEMMIL
jgi:cation diffusion facilitator CzcD-associated flavoprotein CzcO